MSSLKFETIRWRRNALVLIDQRKLPNHYRLIRCRTAQDVWDAIRELKVRGAPAIGIAGAYGLYLGLLEKKVKTRSEGMNALRAVGRFLKIARPTAVNLAWAIDRITKKVGETKENDVRKMTQAVLEEAELIHKEDQVLSEAIGRYGARLIRSGDRILTHCNAGGLATSGYGTALAVLFTACRGNKRVKVFATETRPLLQGARLTMWELKRYGIPAILVCDSAVGALMRQKRIGKVLVGADRIARNGDTANKIGTYSLALLARLHKIPFYVAAPSSTFDFSIPDGSWIPIEERSPEEIVCGLGIRIAPKGIQVYNPAFDVTPHEWISGFITDKGILRPPFSKSFRCLSSSLSPSSTKVEGGQRIGGHERRGAKS